MEKLYQGESKDIEIVIQDAEGVNIAHASILEVWCVVSVEDSKGNFKTLIQFSKNAKTGYKTMVQSATAGVYDCLIERSESKLFPSEGKVYVEGAAKTDSSVFSEEYIAVERQYLFDLAKGDTKKDLKMARTVSEIHTSLIAAKEADSTLSSLNSVSATAIWRLWLWIVAAAISVHEQYLDQSKSDIEEVINGAAPNSAEWIRQRCFEFQYDTNNPQTPILDENYNITYPVINTDYQIVTRCSVKTELDRTVSIKAAKSEPPTALSTSEGNSLKGFVESFSVPGVVYNLISLESDKVYVDADIYYDSIYSAIIQGNVESAIDAYFADLSNTDFDGLMYVSRLQDAIQAVTGVRDVKINVVKCRPNTTVYGSADVIYDLSNSINERFYNPVSGYLAAETTSGYELSDSLNYIPK